MENEIKKLKKLYRTGTEVEKQYVVELLTWLNAWLERGHPKPGDPIPQDDSGDHPPPPPPR